MNNIDKWCAEQCGVELHGHEFVVYESDVGDKIYAIWTIQDPRCREIVREKFRLDVIRAPNEWMAIKRLPALETPCGFTGKGKTIAEAEIACLEAIYEARND